MHVSLHLYCISEIASILPRLLWNNHFFFDFQLPTDRLYFGGQELTVSTWFSSPAKGPVIPSSIHARIHPDMTSVADWPLNMKNQSDHMPALGRSRTPAILGARVARKSLAENRWTCVSCFLCLVFPGPLSSVMAIPVSVTSTVFPVSLPRTLVPVSLFLCLVLCSLHFCLGPCKMFLCLVPCSLFLCLVFAVPVSRAVIPVFVSCAVIPVLAFLCFLACFPFLCLVLCSHFLRFVS